MRLRPFAMVVAVGLAAAASACAPAVVPTPAATTSRAFPDFIEPAVPESLAAEPAAATFERGWRFLEAGDLKSAERDFAGDLRTTPGFYPANVALGYLQLARKDSIAALPYFDGVLVDHADDVSALVGRGQALLALERVSDAIASFSRAFAADPSLTDIRRQVDVLTFRASERNLDVARQAARDKKFDEAIRAYQASIASSPDSAFLYRELAAVEKAKGDNDLALEHLSKAVALDPTDAASLAQTAEILEGRGDLPAALSAYDRSLALDRNAAVKAKRDRASAAADLARLPDQYRAIGGAPQVTRADLAALIGVRLGAVLGRAQRQEADVVTDVRNHWAERWIMAVVSAGVMDPFANHTFQPRTVVHRVDLADAVNHLLVTIASPADVQRWRSRVIRFPDLASGHLAYPAASLAVASGLMAVAPDGSFQPSQSVTGADATAAVERLRTMAGLAGLQ